MVIYLLCGFSVAILGCCKINNVRRMKNVAMAVAPLSVTIILIEIIIGDLTKIQERQTLGLFNNTLLSIQNF